MSAAHRLPTLFNAMSSHSFIADRRLPVLGTVRGVARWLAALRHSGVALFKESDIGR